MHPGPPSRPNFSLPARLHAAVCTASSLATVPWPVCPSTYFHGRIADSVGSVGTGELALPVCQPKTHDEGIAETKGKERSSNVAPRRPPFWPPSARLSRPSTKRSTKVAAVAGDGCRVVSGPGPRPDWGFDRRRRGTAAQASTCQEPTRSEACKLRRAAKSIWQMANIYIRRIGKTPSSPCPFVFTRHAAKV